MMPSFAGGKERSSKPLPCNNGDEKLHSMGMTYPRGCLGTLLLVVLDWNALWPLYRCLAPLARDWDRPPRRLSLLVPLAVHPLDDCISLRCIMGRLLSDPGNACV